MPKLAGLGRPMIRAGLEMVRGEVAEIQIDNLEVLEAGIDLERADLVHRETRRV